MLKRVRDIFDTFFNFSCFGGGSTRLPYYVQ